MIAIIPARGGSQRIPNKNIRDFHGKPIIAYSIELSKESELFDRVIVSTDSDEIAAVALAYGAEVHERLPELARDEIGTQEVVGAVLEDLGVAADTDVCALYPTSPLLEVSDLQAGATFYDRMLYDIGMPLCTFSVETPIDSKAYMAPSGGFYFADASFFMSGRDPYDDGWPVLTNDIDINTMEDWKLAEKRYEERYENQ